MNVRESEDAPSSFMRPRRTSPGSHPLQADYDKYARLIKLTGARID